MQLIGENFLGLQGNLLEVSQGTATEELMVDSPVSHLGTIQLQIQFAIPKLKTEVQYCMIPDVLGIS